MGVSSFSTGLPAIHSAAILSAAPALPPSGSAIASASRISRAAFSVTSSGSPGPTPTKYSMGSSSFYGFCIVNT